MSNRALNVGYRADLPTSNPLKQDRMPNLARDLWSLAGRHPPPPPPPTHPTL